MTDPRNVIIEYPFTVGERIAGERYAVKDAATAAATHPGAVIIGYEGASDLRVNQVAADFLHDRIEAADAAIEVLDAAKASTEALAALTGRVDRVDPVFDVRRYGPYGLGNDVATIQAAVDAAEAAAVSTGRRQNVFFSSRRWDIPGTTRINVDTSRVHLVAESGAELYAPLLASGSGAVHFTGTRTQNVTTLTGNVAKGATTITVASSSGLAVGNMIVLRSLEPFNVERPDYTKGEIADIAGIAGTTVTLAAPTRDSYDDATYNVTVDLITPLVDVGMHNIKVTGGAVNDRYGVRAYYCDGITIDHVDSLNNKYAGIEVHLSRKVRISHCDPIGSNQSGVGYGLRAIGCQDTIIEYVNGLNNRHTVDIDHFPQYPVCRDTVYREVHAYYDISSGISTHGGAEYVTMDRVKAIGCGGGIISRARYTTMLAPEVIGVHVGAESYKHGITIGDGAGHVIGTGIGGTGLRILDARIDVSGAFATDHSAIYSTAPLVDAEISGYFAGFSTHGMMLRGHTTRDTVLHDVKLDCTAQNPALGGTALMGIAFNPLVSADGNNQLRLTFRDVTVQSVLGSGIQVVGNSVAGGNASADLTFDNCRFPSFGNRQIDLNSGWFNRVTFNLGPLESFTNAAVYVSSQIGTSFLFAAGSGNPETVVTAPVGSQYRRAGASGSVFYIKESGGGNTGWVSNNTFKAALDHDGTTAGFFNTTPVTKRTLAAAATDAGTTQALANSLRQALIDLGMGS